MPLRFLVQERARKKLWQPCQQILCSILGRGDLPAHAGTTLTVERHLRTRLANMVEWLKRRNYHGATLKAGHYLNSGNLDSRSCSVLVVPSKMHVTLRGQWVAFVSF